ncbi:glypican-6-like [Lytechinus variegatus]|uniref:glypican-6-like n=1 Tax=Lytechinus variegatus TaxID=7654 RepID=UPI001BB18D1A|nr:glypican-6-like [Lytechinus variegatus]
MKINPPISQSSGLLESDDISHYITIDIVYFIKELIVNSQADLDDMFTRTYDSLYEQNKDLFEDLYTNFRNYYYGRDIDLSEVMGDFFNQLFERIFQLLNPQYKYTDDFWSCTRQDVIMESLKPFGDVANTLIDRAKKSFVAARTFGQGLGFGRDAITRGSKVEPTPECRKALMRMSYCPHCKGIPFVKPCHSLCLNIMKGCLASQSEMDAEWNYYIDAMTSLGNRMDGTLNIETFLLTLEIEISNGIMNMQNNGLSISTKVFNGCGIPPLSRNRRETDPGETGASQPAAPADEDLMMEEDEGEIVAEAPAVVVPAIVPKSESNETKATSSGLNGRQGRRGQGERASGYRYPAPTTAAGTNLDRLIKDVLKRLRDSRPFWSALPYMICDDTSIAEEVTSTSEDNCWNGERVGRYEQDIVGSGIANQRNNPEVMVALTKPVASIRIQKERLETIIDILQLAQNGDDVPFVDHQGLEDGSGSGSGSGSGDGSTGPDDNLFPFSTEFEDPIYRPTRLPSGGEPSAIHRVTSLFLCVVMATVASLLRW